MSHFRRSAPAPEVRGGYQAYRPYVREDFRETCAYCLVHEHLAAGMENFELDHFRPRKRFPDLLNDFYNIYYSCHVCNHIKHDTWPSPALQEVGIGFVDLCHDKFEQHFEQSEDGKWEALTPSAEYTIKSLRLNRDHLARIRRSHGKPPLEE